MIYFSQLSFHLRISIKISKKRENLYKTFRAIKNILASNKSIYKFKMHNLVIYL